MATTTTPHCKLNYHEFNGADLDTQAHLVGEGIYTNDPPFTAPPFTQVAFTALVETHHDKYEAYKNGGKAQKGAYSIARTNLMAALDATAEYVDDLPGVNEDMILLAGFTPTKTGDTAAVKPATPTDVELANGASGEIKAQCSAVAGAGTYGCIVVPGRPLADGNGITNAGQFVVANLTTGNDAFILDLTKSRKKQFSGLTKGVEYFIYFYASNSAGVSQLSAVQSIICG